MDDTDRRAKFVQLAEGRTAKAIDQIRLIGNLSDKRYASNDEDVSRIFTQIEGELAAAKARFKASSHSKTRTAFKLAS